MGKTPDALTPEQKGDLANLAARQSNIAKGTQGLQEKMEEMAKRLEESDPLAASALREAAEQSRKQRDRRQGGRGRRPAREEPDGRGPERPRSRSAAT